MEADHPSLLLLHNYIPLELSSTIASWIKPKSLQSSILLDFMSFTFNHLFRHIWRLQSTAFHQWELSHNITRRRKKQHRKPSRNRSNPLPTPSSDHHSPGLRLGHNHLSSCDRSLQNNSVPPSRRYTSNHLLPIHTHASDRRRFIYLTSSNYLHAGQWFNHYNSLDTDVSPTWSFYDTLGFNRSSLGLSLN